MLSVRKSFVFCILVSFTVAVAICAPLKAPALRATMRLEAFRTAAAPSQAPISPTLPPIISTPQTAPTEPPLTIVVDAAHGGADDGARGANGLKEKDVVLAIARGCRAELTQRGYRVVLTRDGDSDPSFDDRAAIANQFANSFFVTLHVASTGTPSTVRVYYDRFAAPYEMPPLSAGSSPRSDSSPPPSTAAVSPTQAELLLPWRLAQTSFDDASHRFADLVQAGLSQKFSGSPTSSISAAVRDLRSIATPAIAIEISNIGSPNVSALEQMSPSIAAAIAQAVSALHPAANASNNVGAAGAPR